MGQNLYARLSLGVKFLGVPNGNSCAVCPAQGRNVTVNVNS